MTIQELKQAALDSIELPIFALDRDLRVVLANRAFHSACTSRGIPLIEMGTPYQTAIPNLPQETVDRYRRIFETGEPLVTTDAITLGGEDLMVEVMRAPLRNGQCVSQVVVVVRNVTAQKHLERSLRQSEERARLYFKSIPVATYVWEKDGSDFVLRDFNTAADTLTGGHMADFVGTQASQMFVDRPDIMSDLQACAQGEKSFDREMDFTYVTIPHVRFLKAHYAFVPPHTILVHTVDLTDWRRAEAQLVEAHNSLELEVAKRTQELAEANEQLRNEQSALEVKNVALQELYRQAGRNRESVGEQIQSNIERIVLPALERLEAKASATEREDLAIMRESLLQIVSPFVRTLEARVPRLTSREIELCNLIRSGYSTKRVAQMRNTSSQTVLTQRKIIRKKLGILGKPVNLASYLTSISLEERIENCEQLITNK